jgi:cytidylate kinase
MTRRDRPVVAIDGPAGAGKTTVTRQVAKELGYLLVGTGSLYRSVALAAHRRGLSWDDAEQVGELAADLARTGAIALEAGPAGQRVRLDGEDVTDQLVTQHISEGASKVSAHPPVRAALLELQRAAGRDGGVVLEGRDIGTAVFPDAEAKFFLTASAEVRAERRFLELQARGEPADVAAIRQEVEARDRRDSSRAVAPLRQAPDAELVDSSSLSIPEVVEQIVARVRRVEQSLQRSRTE